ncbi:MAG: hypothetical protein CL607_17865 [Anaerolineaceae bacterium]|nr:hypothetical protein [Anaerolineaceae bacterium]
MKLIAAILDERDVDNVMTALTGQNIHLTHISNTGGLLDSGNATLLIGVEEEHVPQVIEVIRDRAASRPSFVPYTYDSTLVSVGIAEVQVGGYLTFVLNVDHFEQV